MQALGHLSCGRAERAMGAKKPPPVKACSLYSAQQGGDIQPLRTVADAVVAGGAGKGGLADHALGLGQQAVHLPAAEGNPHLESGDVGLHLLQVGHAGENHGDAGNGLQEPEGPGRGWVPPGAHGPQGGGLLVGKAARRPPRRGSMTQTGICQLSSSSTFSRPFWKVQSM